MTSKIRGNRLLFVGLIAEITLILLIVYTPWGNTIFGTAPIPVVVWLFALPFAIGMLLLEEARKWVVRRSASRQPDAALLIPAHRRSA